MIQNLLLVLVCKILFFQQSSQDPTSKLMRAQDPSKKASEKTEQKSDYGQQNSGHKQVRISENRDTINLQKANQSSGLKQANPAKGAEKK